jgi:hypothetical protein
MMKTYLQKVIDKKTKKELIFVDVLKVNAENSRIRIRSGCISQRYGSVDPDPHPDPYPNVMDLQHCL